MAEGINAIDDLRSRWLEIIEKNEKSVFFENPDWVKIWVETNKVEQFFYIFLFEDEGVVRGILPLIVKKSVFGMNTVTPAFGEADYYQPSIEPGFENMFFEQLFKYLMSIKNSVLYFPKIKQDYVDFFNKYVNYRDNQHLIKKTVCPYLSLESNPDETIKKFKRQHRNDVKRQKKRLEKLGNLSLEVVKDDHLYYLDSFFECYFSRWKNKKVHIKQDLIRRLKYSYSRLLENFSSSTSSIQFSVLKLNDEAISFHFGFLHQGQLYYYKPTYDLKYHSYSPSKVHLMEIIRRKDEYNIDTINFLQGAEPYKYQWGVKEEFTYWYTINLDVPGWLFSLKYQYFPSFKKYIKKVISK